MTAIGQTAECSELRNAERLIEAHGQDIRYANGLGWIVWDGQRFKPDEGAAIELCKATLRALYLLAYEAVKEAREAVKAAKCKSEEDQERASSALKAALAYSGWIARSKSKPGIKNMLSLASTDGRVRIDASELDANGELLNCTKGTIDLRANALRPFDRADLITKMSPVAFDPGTDISLWMEFLEGITTGDPEMIEELRMLAGYTLLGSRETKKENLFVFALGKPGSGKGTFCDSLRTALGDDYSAITRFDTFLKKQARELTPDLAHLRGARMVYCAEADETGKLDEGALSNYTGGDKVYARTLHEKPIEFYPIFTLWMQANTAPAVNPDEDATGLWRRLRSADFRRVFANTAAERTDFKIQLTDPTIGGPQVLAWAVSGARDYLAGVKIPRSAAGTARTEKLRADNDPIAEFAQRNLLVPPKGARDASPKEDDYRRACKEAGYWIPKAKLRGMYEAYCKDEGILKPLSPQKLKKAYTSPAYRCVEHYDRESSGQVVYGVRERRASDETIENLPPSNDQYVYQEHAAE